MTWKEDFDWGRKRASFRGVEFWISRTQFEAGSRLIVHRFPGKEFAFVQNLGLDNDSFEIQGFVAGDFYHIQRDALTTAIKEEGPGELVHPFFRTGLFTITSKIRWTETKDELGFAAFAFDVIEAPSPDAFERTSARAIAELRAELAEIAAIESMADTWEAPLSDTFSLSLLTDVTTSIGQVNQRINSALGLVDTAAAEIAAFGGQMSTLVASPVRAANTVGAAMATAFQSASSILESTLATGEFFRTGEVLDIILNTGLGLVNTFGDFLNPVLRGSADADRRADNQEVLVQLTRVSALSRVARTILGITPESRTQAVESRDALVAAIDDLQLTANDEGFNELADLKAALVDYFDEIAGTVPEVATHTPRRTIPAILVAHLLYGDPTRDTEIVFRNDVAEPNFLPAETPLEILLDAAA